MKYDYLIVGAGLFGCTFAHLASARGRKVLVIDKRKHLGGLCHTEKVNGILVHKYGAHIFHTNNPNVWDYVNSITPFRQYVNSPLANYFGELYNLPINMNTFHQLFGTITPQDVEEKLSSERVDIKVPANLEEYVLSKVGKTVYEKIVKFYTEKQWGRKCSELPISIIKNIPIRMRYDNNYYDCEYQGIPDDGYTMMCQRMLKSSFVLLGTPFTENFEAMSERVIYTGPIDEYFNYQLGHLNYRSVRFEESVLETDNYQGNAVVNYTDNKPYTRIIEHKHFMPHCDAKGTIITKEYPCNDNEQGEACYPINDMSNDALYEEYLRIAETKPNISFCGRLGEYKYYSMAKTIERAMKLWKSESNI